MKKHEIVFLEDFIGRKGLKLRAHFRKCHSADAFELVLVSNPDHYRENEEYFTIILPVERETNEETTV